MYVTAWLRGCNLGYSYIGQYHHFLFCFSKRSKVWGLWGEETRDSEMRLQNTPQEKNASVTKYQCGPDVTGFFLFLFFFCMCPLTAGKNISSNYSPQHTFCLSPDKGI